MTTKASVNVNDTIRDMRKLGLNVSKLMPKFIARIIFKGEDFMKKAAPYRTGTLRRSISGYPKTKPISILTDMTGMKGRKTKANPEGIPIGVNYAFVANLYSKKPHYIEKTVDHIEKVLIPQESKIVIKQALKRV